MNNETHTPQQKRERERAASSEQRAESRVVRGLRAYHRSAATDLGTRHHAERNSVKDFWQVIAVASMEILYDNVAILWPGLKGEVALLALPWIVRVWRELSESVYFRGDAFGVEQKTFY